MAAGAPAIVAPSVMTKARLRIRRFMLSSYLLSLVNGAGSSARDPLGQPSAFTSERAASLAGCADSACRALRAPGDPRVRPTTPRGTGAFGLPTTQGGWP